MSWKRIVTRRQNVILMHTKLKGWAEQMEKQVGHGFFDMLMICRKEAAEYYVNDKDLEKIETLLMKRLGKISLPEKGISLFQNAINIIKENYKLNLNNKTKKELSKIFKEYFNSMVEAIPFLVLPTFFDEIIIHIFQSFFEKKISGNKTERAIKYLSIITSMPERSYVLEQEKELLEIVYGIRNDSQIKELFNKDLETIKKKIPKKIEEKIEKHLEKFCWVPIQAEEPEWNKEDIIKKIKEKIRDKEIKKRLKEIEEYPNRQKKRKKDILNEFRFPEELKRMVYVYEKWIYLKDFRRSVISQERYYTRKLYSEIGKRLGLSGKEVRFLTPNEMTNALEKDKAINKQEIHKRMDYCVLLRKRNKIKVLTDKQAKKIEQRELKTEVKEKIKEFRGTTAYTGKAKGIVKLLFKIDDINKVKEGDIIAARQTTPDLVPALSRSAAIITDEGGLLSHAAIVAREMKKPCVIGTKIATKVLKDGDLVEVDADKGIIRILKKCLTKK